jgi:hypothetical protein
MGINVSCYVWFIRQNRGALGLKVGRQGSPSVSLRTCTHTPQGEAPPCLTPTLPTCSSAGKAIRCSR